MRLQHFIICNINNVARYSLPFWCVVRNTLRSSKQRKACNYSLFTSLKFVPKLNLMKVIKIKVVVLKYYNVNSPQPLRYSLFTNWLANSKLVIRMFSPSHL